MTTERQRNLDNLRALIYDLFSLEDIKCKVVIDKTDLVNASVEYFSGEYTVKIYSGLINNIQYLIQNKLSRFDDNDRLWFQSFQYLDFLKIFDFDIPESEDENVLYDLKHLFASSIFLVVIFHEMGHVIANHLGKNSVYSEFISDEMGDLKCQEKEMIADWLSIKKFFSLIFSNLEKGSHTEEIEIYLNLLRKATIFTWIVFALEFNLHDALHLDNIDEAKSKKHPPNAVRFYYCTEAMSEAAVDIISTKFGTSDEVSELACLRIFEEAKIYFQSFIQLMPMSYSDLYENPLVYEYYILLRDLPYKDTNQDSSLHLQKLTQEQREVLNISIEYLKQGNKIE